MNLSQKNDKNSHSFYEKNCDDICYQQLFNNDKVVMINKKNDKNSHSFYEKKCDDVCGNTHINNLNNNTINDDFIKKRQKLAQFFHCEKCDYKCFRQNDYKKHLLTKKHNSQKNDKNSHTYKCEKCDYKSIKYCDFLRHTKTRKHSSSDCDNNYNINDNIQLSNEYKQQELKLLNEIVEISKENNDMKLMMLEIIKNNTQNINTNITNNNINTINKKTFNLHFFLNETCKDAMNISDFINNIQIPLSDLENFGKIGYVNGITNIIVNNLKALDVTKRPVHCSDIKREIIYVKDNGVWEKETEDNNKIKNVIKYVSHKNIGRIRDWRLIHPDYTELSSKNSDIYQQIIGGSNDINRVSTNDSENKIIKKLIKEIGINK